MKSIDIILAVIIAKLYNYTTFLKYIKRINSLIKIHVKLMLAI